MSDIAVKNTNRKKTSGMMEKKYVVFLLSLALAILAWLLVSMNQTNEIEKDFTNIKVQLNIEGSLPANNNLTMFGNDEFYVDVSVRGKSYLVNSSSFSDDITVTASLNSVTSAGTYSLPLSADIAGYSDKDASVIGLSKSSISVYFDEKAEKTFELTEEIIEGDNYVLPEGFNLENARLSADSVTLVGPALQINKISSVKAVVTINKEVTGTESFLAEIVPVGSSENSDFDYVSIKDEEPVYITVPVTFTSEFVPVVSFTNMPKVYRDTGVNYTIVPDKIRVSVPANDNELIESDELSVGTIDFSQINNTLNTIVISASDSPYSFADGVTELTVTIDMSEMDKRWLEIPVSTDGVKIPDNATVISKSVMSVQIVGPADSVGVIDSSEAYAVPVLEGIELKSGMNTVPAKIILRTLTDSWVRGNYTVEIEVK